MTAALICIFFIFSDALLIIKILTSVAEEKNASNVAKSNGCWLTLQFSFLSKLYFISMDNKFRVKSNYDIIATFS